MLDYDLEVVEVVLYSFPHETFLNKFVFDHTFMSYEHGMHVFDQPHYLALIRSDLLYGVIGDHGLSEAHVNFYIGH